MYIYIYIYIYFVSTLNVPESAGKGVKENVHFSPCPNVSHVVAKCDWREFE